MTRVLVDVEILHRPVGQIDWSEAAADLLKTVLPIKGDHIRVVGVRTNG
jgi:hypothetical protein